MHVYRFDAPAPRLSAQAEAKIEKLLEASGGQITPEVLKLLEEGTAANDAPSEPRAYDPARRNLAQQRVAHDPMAFLLRQLAEELLGPGAGQLLDPELLPPPPPPRRGFPGGGARPAGRAPSPAQRPGVPAAPGGARRPSSPAPGQAPSGPGAAKGPAPTQGPSPAQKPEGPSPTQGPSGPAPASGAKPADAKDAELMAIQNRTVASAQRELQAGVKEQGGDNRGPRIDEYAKEARMPAGLHWCGYFSNWNYAQAAKESGTEWKGYPGMASKEKARGYFNYRDITDPNAAKKGDALRAQHESEGSTRKYMTFAGSEGDKYATQNKYGHEKYDSHKDLPIRAGDMAVFSHGHVGTVESYDKDSGKLTTIEGNTEGGAVRRKTYDLSTPEGRAKFDGFGRPARGDFAGEVKGEVKAEAEKLEKGEPKPADTKPGETKPEVKPGETKPEVKPGETKPEVKPGETKPADPSKPAATGDVAKIPPRPADAEGGKAFMERISKMGLREREAAIEAELKKGNIPDFLRQTKEVEVKYKDKHGVEHTGKVRVMPDYLAIGSNDDFVRVPMTPKTAQAVADAYGMKLPTPKVVDAVYDQATVKLPVQYEPDRKAEVPTFVHQDARNEAAREKQGGQLGELTAGHKKDLVNSELAQQKPDRVCIYGWHDKDGLDGRKKGERIQPESTKHGDYYVDYSHGVRLMSDTMIVDGKEVPVSEVLSGPNAGILTRTGLPINDRLPNTGELPAGYMR